MMPLGEQLHLGEGIFGISRCVVRADGGEADALLHQHARIGDKAVDHGFDVRAMIADEDDHRALLAGDVGERVGLAIGGGKPERRRRRFEDDLLRRGGHCGVSLSLRCFRRWTLARYCQKTAPAAIAVARAMVYDRGPAPETAPQHEGERQVAEIEQVELERQRNQLDADVRKLVEKYRAIFDWDVPDIDQNAADRLILAEIRKALENIEKNLFG